MITCTGRRVAGIGRLLGGDHRTANTDDRHHSVGIHRRHRGIARLVADRTAAVTAGGIAQGITHRQRQRTDLGKGDSLGGQAGVELITCTGRRVAGIGGFLRSDRRTAGTGHRHQPVGSHRRHGSIAGAIRDRAAAGTAAGGVVQGITH